MPIFINHKNSYKTPQTKPRPQTIRDTFETFRAPMANCIFENRSVSDVTSVLSHIFLLKFNERARYNCPISRQRKFVHGSEQSGATRVIHNLCDYGSLFPLTNSIKIEYFFHARGDIILRPIFKYFSRQLVPFNIYYSSLLGQSVKLSQYNMKI